VSFVSLLFPLILNVMPIALQSMGISFPPLPSASFTSMTVSTPLPPFPSLVCGCYGGASVDEQLFHLLIPLLVFVVSGSKLAPDCTAMSVLFRWEPFLFTLYRGRSEIPDGLIG
ncbi:hypothetical protein PRIPAC_71591, partial [Pristionchus pacificus]|uniref:Uncharacterized protein n=1 Tax=Pristionchus pacificus TaxID=54126 RepID=A0A2A6CAI9_PRIPA